MPRKRLISAVMTFALLAACLLRASDVIDRIVALVNGNIILQSDWYDEMAFEAFSNGRPLEATTPEQRKSALDRLIDRELLREQMPHSDSLSSQDESASADEVKVRVAEVRALYPQAVTAEQWSAVLAEYGLTQSVLERRIAEELSVSRLVDSRLRPSVQIDQKSIESYYNQELLPQLRKSGAKDVPLAEVSPKIKDLLTEKKVNELLTAWLQNLRTGSDIRTNAEPESRAR